MMLMTDATGLEADVEEPNQPGPLGASYYKLMAASTISNLGDGVSVIAYPWLASAVTRSPVLIALVVAAQRLPWLLFTLPAGVITDRGDRRKLMVGANTARAVLTGLVAVAVLMRQGSLPSPDEVAAGNVVSTDVVMYGIVLVATLLLGMAEVLYDNSAQTFMPAIVDQANLEKANGRLWSAEMVANNFVGPPLAGFLLLVAFSLPFFVDATSFLVSAGLVAAIAASPRAASADQSEMVERKRWTTEAKEGFVWLWRHPLFRPMAIILGIYNALGSIVFAIFVLFAQEVLGTSSTEFAFMMTGIAVGGIIGGWTASHLSKLFGEGRSLWLSTSVSGLAMLVVGLIDRWQLAWLLFIVSTILGVLWNVITVSLRQSIIPDELLGRVNSVYRLFAWGMIPVGAAIGGLLVVVAENVGASREVALRTPFMVSALGHFLLTAWTATSLTSSKIAQSRRDAGLEASG